MRDDLRRVPASRATSIVAAIAVLVIGCSPAATPSPPPSSVEPTVPAAPSAPPTQAPTPTPGPTAVPPITPTSDHIVVRVEARTDVDDRWWGVLLYADGSLVDDRSSPSFTVRSLSPTGLETVLGRLRESGLFTSTRVIPAADVPMGFTTFRVTFVDAGRSVTVTAANVSSDPQSRALVALAEGLLDPAPWLPLDAFVDRDPQPHPYQALQSRVTSEVVALEPDAWVNPGQSIDRVAWSLATPPGELGQQVSLPAEPGRHLRCAVVDGLTTAAIRSGLASVPASYVDDDPRTSAWYLWLDGPALLLLTLRGAMPHETAACDTATMPGAPSLAMAPRPSLFEMLVGSSGGLTPADTSPELFVRIGADGSQLAWVSYYADGTILFRDPPPAAVGIGALRLSPSGLQQVHELLDSSGLLAADYSERVPDPDPGPPHRGYSFVTESVVLNATDRGVEAKANAVVALVTKLADPVAWLPASAWLGDPASMLPFRPASISISIRSYAAEYDPTRPTVAGLVWPLPDTREVPDLFRAIQVVAPDYQGQLGWRLSVDQAIAVMGALEGVGARDWAYLSTRVEYLLAVDAAGKVAEVTFAIEAGDWGP